MSELETISVEDFRTQVRGWLGERLQPYVADEPVVWGEGSDDVSILHALEHGEEQALLQRGLDWQAEKFAAGFGALAVPVAFGGAGRPDLAKAFKEEEARFHLPANHEALRVTFNLVGPTVNEVGTDDQKKRFLPMFLGGEALACQLFSEPGAGSDLAAVATKAVRQDGGWVITGQKVWASGAQFAHWGELVARTDPDAPKHKGLTTFLIPMDLPGIEVRPIAQMSGGASFNEVFFEDVFVPDDLRLGEPGEGWKIALMTLGFERGQSGSKQVGGSWAQLRALAEWAGVTDDPILRQELMKVYTHERLRALTRQRAEANAAATGAPGPEGSLGKLLWVRGMLGIGEVAASILGPRLTADTGEWGTYAWNRHVLGARGYRLAGGSDEIQLNLLGERILGLPGEPRPDPSTPWRELVAQARKASS